MRERSHLSCICVLLSDDKRVETLDAFINACTRLRWESFCIFTTITQESGTWNPQAGHDLYDVTVSSWCRNPSFTTRFSGNTATFSASTSPLLSGILFYFDEHPVHEASLFRLLPVVLAYLPLCVACNNIHERILRAMLPWRTFCSHCAATLNFCLVPLRIDKQKTSPDFSNSKRQYLRLPRIAKTAFDSYNTTSFVHIYMDLWNCCKQCLSDPRLVKNYWEGV